MRLPLPLCAMILLPALVGAEALDCENAVTTVDMVACAERDYETADRRLNEVFKAAMEKCRGETRSVLRLGALPGGGAKPEDLLLEAQRKWLAFRDAHCAYERARHYGGTIGAVLHVACLADMTEARTRSLETALEDGEGLVESPR